METNISGHRLLVAAESELDGIDPDVWAKVPAAVAAVLRALSEELYNGGLAAIEPGELARLADDIEGGGE